MGASSGNSSAAMRGLEQLQTSLRCCGAEMFSDWQESPWSKGEGEKVPPSCCKSPSPLCGVRDHPSNIHYQGCGPALVLLLQERLLLVVGLAVLGLVVQGGGVCLA